MSNYKTRMREEYYELKARIEKLEIAIAKMDMQWRKLCDEIVKSDNQEEIRAKGDELNGKRILMSNQRDAMYEYKIALLERMVWEGMFDD